MDNTTPPIPNPLVGEALDLLGGDSAVAKMLTVRPWAISKWRKSLPASRVLWLAEKTNWRYTPHQLAPTLYPNETDGIPPGFVQDVDAPAVSDDVQPPVGGSNKSSKSARMVI